MFFKVYNSIRKRHTTHFFLMAKSQTNISQKITKWWIRIWKNAHNYYSSEKWKLEIAVPLSRSPSGHCRSSHLTAIYYLFGFLKKPKGERRCVFIICMCLSILLTYLSPKFLFLSHHPSLSLSGFITPPHHMMRLGSVRVQSQHVASKWYNWEWHPGLLTQRAMRWRQLASVPGWGV